MTIIKEFEKLLKSGNIPEDVLQSLIDEYDPNIHVDRAAPVLYPDWIGKALYPQFELIGPSDFNVAELESFLHPKQEKGLVEGNVIHDKLIAKKMIEGCLGLNDLKAIQARGIGFFRKHYSGKAVFGWRSVVRDRYVYLSVPYLVGRDGEAILRWRWLGYDWDSRSPALRFRK